MKIGSVNGTGTVLVRDDGTLLSVSGALRAKAALTGREAALPTDATPLEIAQQAAAYRVALTEAAEALERAGRLGEFVLSAETPLLSPISRPNRVLAIGRNYAEHAKELGNSVPDDPIVFQKASTCVIGPGDAIEIPSWVGRVDYEGELLVVLGAGGHSVAEADAMGLVAAYSVFNDVTAREKQRAAQEKKQPWFLAKSMDTFGPLGPWLVTADEISDPHHLALSLTVNGETRQNDSTASMIYRIPTLIAYLSRWFALEAGDVIATGTPSGVGPLVPGDIVTITVEGVGTLSNPVIAA